MNGATIGLLSGQRCQVESNMEAQEMSNQDQDGLAGDVMQSVGMPEEAGDEVNQSHESAGSASPGENGQDPLYVQKRLKQQKRAHDREMREMHARMADMQSRLPQSQSQAMNPYADEGQPLGVDEQIHKAVSYALQHRDMEERKAKEAQSHAHVQKQYNEMYKHLDSMGDKYDDFHDKVFGEDTQFSPAMRDYAMTLPRSGSGSAGEVLYSLSKNPEELERIAKLHPIDQASEMSKLSHALIRGGENKATSPRPLGQIKNNPVNNSNYSVTDKTPVSELRKRMKAGWK
jgi:hypothetical protein